MRERRLSGVQLVISDAYACLTKATACCCQVSSSHLFCIHSTRNLLLKLPKASQYMVALALQSLFVQQDGLLVLLQ